ncbi:LSM-domain-containing protein [Acaromyces ingoldii]|uniref:U6 snRNA-associated Sm-like protein LSm6 n=1 Tax=Acaromyces ingoldii TaxID=215250 RepID=A0A316YXW7_9BASI|nr:LSM-domain-containing protein [Acaromyces ingoldii]PWN93972.1 LSM-domain-containing protein [Acaromyces ingoldii]
MSDTESPAPGQGKDASGLDGSSAYAQQPAKGSPNDFLKKVIGKNVIVRLNSGVDYYGVLSCLDGFMNIALEDTHEVVAGVSRNRYGDAFIRGNNVLYITARD